MITVLEHSFGGRAFPEEAFILWQHGRIVTPITGSLGRARQTLALVGTLLARRHPGRGATVPQKDTADSNISQQRL